MEGNGVATASCGCLFVKRLEPECGAIEASRTINDFYGNPLLCTMHSGRQVVLGVCHNGGVMVMLVMMLLMLVMMVMMLMVMLVMTLLVMLVMVMLVMMLMVMLVMVMLAMMLMTMMMRWRRRRRGGGGCC